MKDLPQYIKESYINEKLKLSDVKIHKSKGIPKFPDERTIFFEDLEIVCNNKDIRDYIMINCPCNYVNPDEDIFDQSEMTINYLKNKIDLLLGNTFSNQGPPFLTFRLEGKVNIKAMLEMGNYIIPGELKFTFTDNFVDKMRASDAKKLLEEVHQIVLIIINQLR